METSVPSETSVLVRATRRKIPEDGILLNSPVLIKILRDDYSVNVIVEIARSFA
jgi:hypothetical protein